MAIRLTIDGVNIECDTPEEVAALIRAARPSKAGQTRTVSPGAGRLAARGAVATTKVQSPGLFKPSELDDRAFKGMQLEVLSAMKEAFPNGVSSDQLAARIGRSRRSIPIILVSLQKYAESRNHRFDDLVLRGKAPRGEKGSTYSLTPRGMKEFF